MPIQVIRFDLLTPDDIAGLVGPLSAIASDQISRMALFIKVGGEYEDGSRERAKAAIDRLLNDQGLADRAEMVTVIGCEGASTPCGCAFVEVTGTDDKSAAPRLAIGRARAMPRSEPTLHLASFGFEVCDVTREAMRDAGLEPADVVGVFVNSPNPSTGDTKDRARRARAVAALGAGVAIGDIARDELTDAAIVDKPALFTRRVQTFIGPTVRQIEVIVIGNRAGAGGDLVACGGVTTDLLDMRSIRKMLVAAGLHLDADGEVADPGRIVATLVKAGVGAGGVVAGAPTTIFTSATPPEKHVRAALSGALGATLHTTRMFSTYDPIQQAPPGGMTICCVIREP